MRAAVLALVLCFASAAVAAQGAAPERGDRAFLFCSACHAVKADESGVPLGPNLAGIIGRRVADQPGFDYSPAMRALAARQPVWTADLLDHFIEKPQEVVPDTTMAFFGIAAASRRAAIIDYLKSTGK